jgi:hypothetical protein
MRLSRLFARIMKRLANGRPRSHLARGAIVLATGMALLTGTAARADDLAAAGGDPTVVVPFVLATGGVFGGITQNLAVCYAYNAGPLPVTISGVVIRDQNGVLDKIGCVQRLAPFKICSVAVPISTVLAYSCTIRGFKPVASVLRGVMDIRDIARRVLINSNLE